MLIIRWLPDGLRGLRCGAVALALLGFARVGVAAEVESAVKYAELKPERIAKIAAMLPAEPAGVGRPITDRAYWSSAAVQARVAEVAANAEEFRTTPFPEWKDDVYLETTRTGVRVNGDAMIRARGSRLLPLVVAECVENKGRYVEAIRTALKEYVKQPTWTLPAHDMGLGSFRGTKYEVDLGSSIMAADLAQALWLLGDRISSDQRAEVIAAIETRVLKPVRASLVSGSGHWWMGSAKRPSQNNWNAVCLSGVAQAATTLLVDREDRAQFVAAGEHYSRYFLNGIRASGYCDEGGGYWVYGFGNFMNLRETLLRNTGGQIELLSLPRARNAALFGSQYQLTGGLVPTFADSRFGTKVDERLVNFCLVAFGLGGDSAIAATWGPRVSTILVEPTPMKGGAGTAEAVGFRTYFDDVGVLVCRPATGGGSTMGLAVKAGGNSSHSHNDVGAFVISLGEEMPVGDPGGPLAYDAKTFGKERYTHALFNSYGHPVPVIGGKLQRDATQVKPKVLRASFTDAADVIVIDLTPAYQVPTLVSAVRTVTFVRSGKGEVRVRDEFVFTAATDVEEAITTRGRAERVGDGQSVKFVAGSEALVATVEPGIDAKIEEILDMGIKFGRVGWKVKLAEKGGSVEMVLRPE